MDGSLPGPGQVGSANLRHWDGLCTPDGPNSGPVHIFNTPTRNNTCTDKICIDNTNVFWDTFER